MIKLFKSAPKYLNNFLDQHTYPEVFQKYPLLVIVVYVINIIMTLRNWHVLRAFRKIERKMPNDLIFMDAGCGMGEFAIRLAMRKPSAQVYGIDFNDSNILLVNSLAKYMQLNNAFFRQADLSLYNSEILFDLVLCNSTLQFIKADDDALQNIANMLKKDGLLILYVPIRYKRYLPWSEYLENKYLSDFFYKYHANFLMHRYSDNEIISKVKSKGLNIVNVNYAYNFCGALAFELYSTLIVVLKKLPIYFSIPVIILYLFSFFPVQLILMFVDFIIKNKNGNGLLIIAQKKS